MPEETVDGDRFVLDDFWEALRACGRDLPLLLRTIAQRVVDLVGEGCVITTVSADGTELRPEVVTHPDAEMAAAMQAALGADSIRIGEGVAGSVAADRHAVLLNDLVPETFSDATTDQFIPFVQEQPMRALMIVPLVAGQELVGTLGAVRTSSAEGYTTEDLQVLEALADRAAIAIADATAAPTSIGSSDYEAIYRFNLDGVLLTTPDGHILAANPAACSMLQLSERQIVEGGREALMVADDPNLGTALAQRAATGHVRAELQMRRGDGTTFVADVSSTIFTTSDGRLRASVIFRDVTDEVAAREGTVNRLAELEVIADHDALTGLLNRRGFALACHQVLAAADRHDVVSQCLYIDVDGLKAINDSEGHAAGDAAILAVASAIHRALREADVAGRLGGDEFAIVVTDTSAADALRVVDRIRAELHADPHTPAGLSFSVGITERPPHDVRRLDDIVDAADRDMYQSRMFRRLRGEQAPSAS